LKILAISGSLRGASINSALLRATCRLAPPGIVVHLFTGLGEMPLFNPDLDGDPQPAVQTFRAQVAAADALIIASPEYAHGLTGAIKNGLDWLVSYEPFAFKPVAVLNASPRAHHADDALREVLRTMNATLVESASVTVPLLGSGLDEGGMVNTPSVAAVIRDCLASLYDTVMLQQSSRLPSYPLR
jgi:NAD(P)H-dependent FMN reductase